MPLSDFAIRITYPYEALPKMVRAWSLHAKRMVFYEHNDDGAERIHCHVHVEDCDVSYKRLVQLADEAGVKSTYPIPGKRAGSLFSHREKEYDKSPKGYSYLTKGKYEASYLQGWTKEDTDEWKSNWVPRGKAIKRTYWMELYDAYALYAPEPPLHGVDWDAWYRSTEVTPPRDRFGELVKSVRAWVWKRNHGYSCPAINREIEHTVRTHCYKHNISIPDKWKPQ